MGTESVIDRVLDSFDTNSPLQVILAVVVLGVGLLKCVQATASFLCFVFRHFLRPVDKLSKYGKWAIVTGATDGIGREYCDLLAAQGLNIYLIARTTYKLSAAADEIAGKYGVETKFYTADLVAAGATADSPCWFGMRSNLEGLDVGVLINNAGMSYGHPEFLHNIDRSEINNIVNINAIAVTQMMHIVLPGMKERGRGCIVNISSGVSAALPSCPLLAVYAASKAYVDTLTAAVSAEYRAFGVRCQVQAPAFVATKMAKMRRTSLAVPSPAKWAACGMRHLGRETRAFPYPVHALLSSCLASLPGALATGVWMNMASGMRARALKKKAASKGQ